MKVKIKDIVSADEAIFRWSNLQVPAAMSMTLGLVVRAIRPILEQFDDEQHKMNHAAGDYLDEINPTGPDGERKPITAAMKRLLAARNLELEEQLKEVGEQEVELVGISAIKLSRFKKAKIVPSGRELALAWWLIEYDVDANDFEGVEEARSLKETHSHA